MFSRRKRERVAPDRDAVVERVLCISVVAMLGAIAAGLDDGTMDEEQAPLYVTESHRWLIREGLTNALSHEERALIAKPLADWSEAESMAARWRNEALGVLLWALSVVDDIPSYDTRFESLPSAVPLLAPTTGFREAASLRSAEAIERARGLAELSYRALDADESGATGSIAFQRHYALTWLTGYASDWDRVPTGT